LLGRLGGRRNARPSEHCAGGDRRKNPTCAAGHYRLLSCPLIVKHAASLFPLPGLHDPSIAGSKPNGQAPTRASCVGPAWEGPTSHSLSLVKPSEDRLEIRPPQSGATSETVALRTDFRRCEGSSPTIRFSRTDHRSPSWAALQVGQIRSVSTIFFG